MIIRINPEIWVMTPKGEGEAMFLIDYGPSINSIWVVALIPSREVIHVDSAQIKVMGNAMWQIPHPEAPK